MSKTRDNLLKKSILCTIRTTTKITYVLTLQYATMVVYCVGRVHKQLSGSILYRQGTQYASRGSILCREHIVALQSHHIS